MSSSQTYALSDYRQENKKDMYMKSEKDNLENTINKRFPNKTKKSIIIKRQNNSRI